ncbi:phenylcoumaran benzylic ether reductase Pyrc5-like isoform X1 [Gastrolobium bilobum]|uniref:phenylcoumaran benzylic ether reductase Pyrc5-like isoform X1 n=1 Tax=Gastrolobium bilobum TaxID=150636 RepID=UPI002AB03C7C|nr:phenylcoumaran benzylic ether reductase Pyrc5-like isoform X1 [Gastrolobium bilobum]
MASLLFIKFCRFFLNGGGSFLRFFPSEIGNDVDRAHAVDPAKSAFQVKAIEAEGISRTFVLANLFAVYFLLPLSQPGVKSQPKDKVVILGDGTAKVRSHFFAFQVQMCPPFIKFLDPPLYVLCQD